MNWIPVTSSNLRAVAYDQGSRVLVVRFRDGSVYEYEGVPGHIFDGLMAAGSKGRYHHLHIVGRYPYRKVG